MGADAGDRSPADDLEELRAEVELLAAENRALREARARRQQARYRRTAVGLVALGALAGLAALAFPGSRPVLFALAATGGFAGLLTYYLAPERFIAAGVGESSHAAYAEAVAGVADELGLADRRVYVPRPDRTGAARLFLPQHAEHAIPGADALGSVFVVTEDPAARGVSLPPTGLPLLRELREALAGPLAGEPDALADQLCDGLVEAFELAERATPDVDAADGRLTVAIAGSTYGGLGRDDHPVASLLGVGMAVGLGVPVTVETAVADDDRADHLVTCRWAPEDAG